MSNYPCVLVVGDEKKTRAYRFMDNGKIEKGLAELKAGDKPKPIVGAVIALCKALGCKPVDAALDVLRAYSTPKYAGDIARRIMEDQAGGKKFEPKVKKPPVKVQVVKRPDPDYPRKGECIGLISTQFGHAELELDATLAAGLDFKVKSMGRMGDLSPFVDRNGKTLHVGDLVIVEMRSGSTRDGKKWVSVPGLNFVVDEVSDDTKTKGAYIMGMCGACNAKTGEIDSQFRVRLAKKWYEVELGEEHSFVHTVWKGATH